MPYPRDFFRSSFRMWLISFDEEGFKCIQAIVRLLSWQLHCCALVYNPGCKPSIHPSTTSSKQQPLFPTLPRSTFPLDSLTPLLGFFVPRSLSVLLNPTPDIFPRHLCVSRPPPVSSAPSSSSSPPCVTITTPYSSVATPSRVRWPRAQHSSRESGLSQHLLAKKEHIRRSVTSYAQCARERRWRRRGRTLMFIIRSRSSRLIKGGNVHPCVPRRTLWRDELTVFESQFSF